MAIGRVRQGKRAYTKCKIEGCDGNLGQWPGPRQLYCEKHYLGNHRTSKQLKAYRSKWRRKEYARRKAEGLCVQMSCRLRAARGGLCQVHWGESAERHREAYLRKRKKLLQAREPQFRARDSVTRAKVQAKRKEGQ